MIDSEGDVPDAVDHVGADDGELAGRSGDLDPGLRRMHDRRPLPAVEELDADEDVRDRRLETRKLDALPAEASGPGVDRAALKERIGELLDRRLFQVPHVR